MYIFELGPAMSIVNSKASEKGLISPGPVSDMQIFLRCFPEN